MASLEDPRERRIARAFVGLILVSTALLHGPWLSAPFGPGAVNAGAYFGPFAQSFHTFGFARLRGAPLVASTLGHPRNGLVYLHHPPGTAWVVSALGTSEWCLRLPTVLAQCVAALALARLLSTEWGALRAGMAGLGLTVLPVLVFFAQVSYEPLVLAAGLMALLGVDRLTRGQGRARHGFMVVAALLLGPWLDWAFSFYAAALAVLILARVRPWSRALRWTAGVGVLAVLATLPIFLWKLWALAGPSISPPPPTTLTEMMSVTIGHRPSWREFLKGAWSGLDQGFTPALVVVAVSGLIPLLRRHATMAAALALPGFANVMVFAEHARTHIFYFAYLAPFLLAAATSSVLPRFSAMRRFGPLLVLVLGTLAVSRSATLQEHGAHPYFRDLGRAIDLAAADVEESRFVRAWRVHVTVPYAYPYYYRSPIAFMNPSAAKMESERLLGDAVGVRCLRLDVEIRPRGAPVSHSVSPILAEYLSRFPYVDLPNLSTVLSNPLDGSTVKIEAARLYTLR